MAVGGGDGDNFFFQLAGLECIDPCVQVVAVVVPDLLFADLAAAAGLENLYLGYVGCYQFLE